MRGIGVFVFCLEVRGAGRRSACSSNGKGNGNDKRNPFLIRDKQAAIQAVGKFHGFPGVAAFGRQRRQGDGAGPEGDDVVGARGEANRAERKMRRTVPATQTLPT
jgi:hypothetical protein